jgi:hypothetical protein
MYMKCGRYILYLMISAALSDPTIGKLLLSKFILDL